MVIRDQQMLAFSQASLTKFEVRMRDHLQRCFPSECAALREQGVQNAIRYGIERAASYGISAQRDVCKYIDLMFTFGDDFDRDASLPWAALILEDKRCKNASVRMERLYAAAKRHNAVAAH